MKGEIAVRCHIMWIHVVKPQQKRLGRMDCQYPWAWWKWVCFILGFVTHLYDLFLWEGECCQVFADFFCLHIEKTSSFSNIWHFTAFFCTKKPPFSATTSQRVFPFSVILTTQKSDVLHCGRDDEVVEVRCGFALAFYRYVYILGKL